MTRQRSSVLPRTDDWFLKPALYGELSDSVDLVLLATERKVLISNRM
jgi:hypothetical protein